MDAVSNARIVQRVRPGVGASGDDPDAGEVVTPPAGVRIDSVGRERAVDELNLGATFDGPQGDFDDGGTGGHAMPVAFVSPGEYHPTRGIDLEVPARDHVDPIRHHAKYPTDSRVDFDVGADPSQHLGGVGKEREYRGRRCSDDHSLVDDRLRR